MGELYMEKSPIILHDEPFIACYEQVVTAIECQQIIDLAQNQLQPSTIIGESEVETSRVRTSENTWLRHNSHILINEISNRIASTIKQQLNYAESLQVARYLVDGKFDAHFDSFDLETKAGQKYVSQGGQRLITALLYLNTVDSGGETYFPALNIRVTPSSGTLLVFENCKKGTNEKHPSSQHEGCSVKKGEKWIATLWFRDRPQY